MAQITLYLDKQTESELRRRARRSGLSLSKWSAKVLKEKARCEWSDEIKNLAGAWPDLPDAATLRTDMASIQPREKL
jgi:hypothetical protein